MSCAAFLLSGCAASAVVVGVPEVVGMASGASMQAEIGDRSVQSNYPDLGGISYSASPFNWKAVSDPNQFIIALDFWRGNVREPFGEIELDLSKIALVTEGGARVEPSAYGLTYRNRISQGCRDGHPNHAPPRLVQQGYAPIPPTRIKLRAPWPNSFLSECVNVVFEIPTQAPGSKFRIEVAGVRYGNAELPISTVSFRKGYGND